jgi:hypothetical protein
LDTAQSRGGGVEAVKSKSPGIAKSTIATNIGIFLIFDSPVRPSKSGIELQPDDVADVHDFA